MLMLMPMLMMLALTMMLLLDAAAYAGANNDANADTKMPNVARHLACAYVVMLLPPLLPMLMLFMQMLWADDNDDVMLKRVCICVRLCLSTAGVFVMFVYMPLCVSAFALRVQLHSKARHF